MTAASDPVLGLASAHVSTHVLDTRLGRPAADVPVRLDAYLDDTWRPVAEGATDADGRWSAPSGGRPADGAGPATYRLRFGTGPYFAGLGVATFYPEVSVIFTIADPGDRHHVPLLLSPFGYSTYRGS
ncbi:hydroxyisourate hydrolase [Actinomadura sp. 21ATH]|uniref:hydroxyisourate hydrolase n=1 Tax=Actinomadura sp. 21ATH TaxID=1735444 RepID=UPI0035BF0170